MIWNVLSSYPLFVRSISHHLSPQSTKFIHQLIHEPTPRTAPLLEAVEYEEVNWANDFDQPSIYRGYPNPQREKAWEKLWRRSSLAFPFCLLAYANYRV